MIAVSVIGPGVQVFRVGEKMNTLEQAFDDFFNQSYGPVKGLTEGQKREIKMNFYSGVFAATLPRTHKLDYSLDAKKWIRGYILQRLKEEKMQ